MRGETILLDTLNGQRAAAWITDGKLHDFLIDSLDGTPSPGTIFRATVDRTIKGQGGVFLRLPDGTAHLRDGKGLSPGQSLLVQVTGYSEPEKAVPVTAKVLFKSKFVIVTPGAAGANLSRSIKDEEVRAQLRSILSEVTLPDGCGLILRSAAADGSPDEIIEDIDEMITLCRAVMRDTEGLPECLIEGPDAHHLAWREWGQPKDVRTTSGCFADMGVLDALDGLKSAQTSLAGGGHMWIEPTRALVAIDVNSGSDVSPAACLKANIAAAREVPRQLRLRGLGGQITLDLAPLAKKDRTQFENTLRSAFRLDGIETALVGWTPLGHFELQRKRERRPIAEIFA